MSLRVSFHTLGCKLNFSESSTLARHFEQEGGFVRVEPNAEADICIINSCSVTEHSDKKCRNLIRKLHRRNPSAIIAVTGCYAQLKPHDIAAINGVDIVLSNNDKGDMLKQVLLLTTRAESDETKPPVVTSCTTDELTSFFASFSSGDRTRAFLKVQDGCDYKCSYCTIHYARGKSRNAPIADVVEQARKIAESGAREIVITGINTGDFGRTTGERFIDLLRALNEVEGIDRYRISSIEPNLLTDEIIEFCAASPKFQHHFHIPLQSGSDEILGLMRRRYTTAKFAERVAAVRRAMPDAFIGIDVIVGFPSESDAHFDETYNFLESIKPSFLHIFPFSERRGTPAVDFRGKVAPYIATERAARLELLSKRLHREFCSAAIGKRYDVLVESTMKRGSMFGYTGEYRRVAIKYDRTLINKIISVEITGVDGSGLADLSGRVVTE
ncbi:MAG: tRNA (N(6)-L-threonylcarbamoyladenosine(37)-C(2))-methylthiotransferase MtaB [Rikenellaceae bacterium]